MTDVAERRALDAARKRRERAQKRAVKDNPTRAFLEAVVEDGEKAVNEGRANSWHLGNVAAAIELIDQLDGAAKNDPYGEQCEVGDSVPSRLREAWGDNTTYGDLTAVHDLMYRRWLGEHPEVVRAEVPDAIRDHARRVITYARDLLRTGKASSTIVKQGLAGAKVLMRAEGGCPIEQYNHYLMQAWFVRQHLAWLDVGRDRDDPSLLPYYDLAEDAWPC